MKAPLSYYGQVIIFSLVNYLPYLLMAMYPFRKKLRFSKPVTIWAIVLLSVWEVILEILAVIIFPAHDQIFTLLNTIVFVATYFLLVHDALGKIVFTLMVLTNFANFILIASTYLSSIIWGSNIDIPDHWTTSLLMLLMQIVILLPLKQYFTRYYIPAIRESYDSYWNYLWIIPITFYIIWNFIIYYVPDYSSYQMALRKSTTLVLLLITIGSCVIYHIAIMMISAQQERLKLEQEKRLWEISSLQFKTIKDRITESRIIRHDLRHEVMILQTLLVEQKYDEIQTHLERYGARLSHGASCVFCENETANIIIGFFAQQAKALNIQFNAKVCFPSSFSLDELEVGVLLANLLENAVDACRLSSVPDKTIDLSIRTQGDSVLALSIQNTSDPNPLEAEGEFFRSTKHEGVGMGLTSVRRIVERHQGTLNIKQEGCTFSLSFVLYLN